MCVKNLPTDPPVRTTGETGEVEGLARKQHVNRENKLAIIIGFSLVLVVAVLISDHFSRASMAQIGAEISAATSQDVGAGTAGLTRPIGGPDSLPAHAGPLSELTDSRTRTVADTATPAHEPEEILMYPTSPGPSDVVDPTAKKDPAALMEQFESVESRGGSTPAVPARPFSEGAMKTHEVKEGDKLFRIAAQHYGDGTLWKALAEYNGSRVPNPSVLRVGVTLQIPPKDVLLGEAVLAPAGQAPKKIPGARKPAAAPKDVPKAKSTPVERSIAKAEKPGKDAVATYKIARGDSLGTIAQKLLGTSRRAKELYQLNKGVLEDENTLIPGTVIKLPAR